MAVAQTNPELVIDIKYNSVKAEQDYAKISRRIEQLANEHQSRLNNIQSKLKPIQPPALSRDYYVNQEGLLQRHVERLNKLNQQASQQLLTTHNKFQSTAINGYKDYYGRLESLTSKGKDVHKELTTLLNKQTAVVTGLGNALNTKFDSGSLGSALLGGAVVAGVNNNASLTNALLPNLSKIDFTSIKRELADKYRDINSHIKLNLPFDEDSHKQIEYYKGQLQGIKEHIQGLTYSQKDYNNVWKNHNKVIEEHNNKLTDTNRKLDQGANSSMKMWDFAKLTAAAYGAWNITEFLLDISVAAAKTEQMERAFYKMGGNAALIDKLADATHNAVSKSKLLATANYGKFMGVDLEKLPALLKFASVRAAETGQSVDYLVQSLIMGLGRKSPMILDNLGLKMSDLDAEIIKLAASHGLVVNKVGELEREFFLMDAASIVAQKAIDNTAVSLDNAATKTERLLAGWQNFKEKLGESFIGDIAEWNLNQYTRLVELRFGDFFEGFLGSVDDGKQIQMMSPHTEIAKEQKEADRRKKLIEDYKKAIEEARKSTNAGNQKSFLETLTEEVSLREKLRKQTTENIRAIETQSQKYAGNTDVLQLLNEKLKEQQMILRDLDNYAKAVDVAGSMKWLRSLPDMHKPATQWLDTTSEDYKKERREDIENKFNQNFDKFRNSTVGQVQAHLDNVKAIENEIVEWQNLLSVYSNVPNAIDFITGKIAGLNEQLTTNTIDGFTQFYQQYSQVINEAANLTLTFYDAQLDSLYNQLDVHQELMNLENERWANQSKLMEEAGIKNTAYYVKLRKEHEATVKRQTDQEYQMKGELWEAEKDSRLTQTIMNTAQGIMSAWTITPPNPVLSGILSALIGATGVVQATTISGQTNPYRRNAGGWIPGGGFTDDRYALLTGGEFIVNRNAARENASMLESINSGSRVSNSPTLTLHLTIEGNVLGEQRYVEEKLIPAIQEAVAKGYSISTN